MQRLGIRGQGTGWRFRAALAVALMCGGLSAQQIQLGLDDARAAARKQHVLLLSDTLEVSAGSVQTVELRFRVDPGFHINSHVPKDELLIPTALKLEETPGLKVTSETYPKGSPFQIGSGKDMQTLDVYQNEFRVGLRITAPRGASMVTGTLHYQACDNAACFPPRNLPVKIAVTAR